MPLELFSLIVDDYDEAIAFFTRTLGFELAEDAPSLTTDGRPKRWVVVRPADGGAGLVLARADGAHQVAAVGRQFAGRVGLFLRVQDFDATLARIDEAGCELVTITQYLRPSARHHPVSRWVHPDEFVELAAEAERVGFSGVMSGPLVRSSYRAGRLYAQAMQKRA